jgi:transcriptional regulator with XRE-family HTH domain
MADALLLTFGERVRTARRDKGISQERLGELCGLHRTYVGHVERGSVNPTLVSIVRIAGALEMNAAVLVDGLTAPKDAVARPRR